MKIILVLTLVLALHGCAELNHLGQYLPGQFEPQEGFIKLRSPEPDEFNPYKDHPHYFWVSGWVKYCEWWPIEWLGN
ncbi:MAG: hypothetical protein A2169_08535 [Deltaproteobacteria bacterium RBG_13_47_9]|nr:MAG: hypothetical protein A2169_08535 [Deltaproteobacteria bacterium RBG_13_47_9]